MEKGRIKWNTLRSIIEAFIYSWYSKYRGNLLFILLVCSLRPEKLEEFNEGMMRLLEEAGEATAYAKASGRPLWKVFRRVDPFFKGWVNIEDIVRKEVGKHSSLLKETGGGGIPPNGEEDLLEYFYSIVFHPFLWATFTLPLFYDTLTFKVSLRFTDVLKFSSLDRETAARGLKKMVGMGFLEKRGKKKAKEYFLTSEGLNKYFDAMFFQFLEYLSKEDVDRFLTLLLMWKGAINVIESDIYYRILLPGELKDLKRDLELKKPVELENLQRIRETIDKYPMLKLKKRMVKPETRVYLRILPKPPLTNKELDFLIKQAEELKKYKERLRSIERIKKEGEAYILQSYEVADELGTKHQDKKIVEFLRRKRMKVEEKWNT